ncbi:DUF1778 domain-containing protein [Desulforhopalus sp. IMCC35007]|uniref:type II toxin-antitoxin system TacA family antitoxin n=1 Tax=Desulforhopalus sp. IMCC35007 TaxID=2569543 RepID=UPI0010AE46D3|nr:DUF1778 domain-containing protein [Desulforhopalus sp. IMCC35007]TKB11805.1 DUF1778 domain-containing protein [Desulforhopalus sp. IMCC35007]
MATTARERIEMRVSPEVKILAERASAAMGCSSLTEFVTGLIREHAPSILAKQTTIELSNTQFDNFLSVCNDQTLKPGKSLLKAAKKLDDEGY